MIHSIRWTLPKSEQRIKVIEPLIYRHQAIIPSFRYRVLSGEEALQAVGREIDASAWGVIEPLSHWGQAATNYVLRSSFQIPADWSLDAPCALFLRLVDS